MNSHTVIIHFQSAHDTYAERSIWAWSDGDEGVDFPFIHTDNFGGVASVRLPLVSARSRDISDINVLIRNADFSYKSSELRIHLVEGENSTEVWIVENDDTVYYSRQAALTSPQSTHYDPHAFDMALHSDEFDKHWGFSGWLGYRYTPELTEFRLWAPTVSGVNLIVFESDQNTSPIYRIIPMSRGEDVNPSDHAHNTHGVWFAQAQDDMQGKAYVFAIYYADGPSSRSVDPYARATTEDGIRSVVVAEDSITPDGFSVVHGEDAYWRMPNPTEAVIAEMHIRDFSISHSSGVPRHLRGTYRGAATHSTTNAYGDPTCLDYVEQQGYSYVQLQPVASRYHHYISASRIQYNWGYDPTHYNVPEMLYATDPRNPRAAILELKQMIQTYHDSGIGVILDVVYNHTYSTRTHPFQLTVPDYFYRMNADGTFANGSGCGNEVASDKEMCRKYIIDSVMYWATEFGVDGFRFDLMGLLDIKSMNDIREQLDTLDPHILMYGEGWNMGTLLPQHDRAMKANAHLTPRIGYFNDDVRDAIKGAEVYGNIKSGFVSHEATESIIAKGILGSGELTPFDSPRQVVNYVEAHDNFNLNDLLIQLHTDDDEMTHIQRIELANALNVVMQGICFMQIGQEFMRTKLHATGEEGELTVADTLRAMNSYNSPDIVNRVNWDNIRDNADTVHFVRQLITLKTQSGLFSYETYDDIRDHVFVWSAVAGSGIVGFDITDEEKKYRIVVTTVDIPVHNVVKDFPHARLVLSNNSLKIEKERIIEAYSLAIFEQ